MTKVEMSIDQIKQSLAALPYFDSLAIESVTPFLNGLSHKVFKVSCFSRSQNKRFTLVAKLIAGHETGVKEVSVSKRMAKLQLTPDVLFSNRQWLITQYLVGITLESAHFSMLKKLKMSLELLFKLYSTNGNQKINSVQAFDPIPYVISLIQTSALSESIQEKLLALVNEQDVDIRCLDKFVIHGDANFNNFIFDKGDQLLKMIDFEASSYSTREYDIAMLLAVNYIPSSTIYLVLNSELKLLEIDIEMVTRYAVISSIINVLWYLEQFNKTGLMLYKTNAKKTLDYLDNETKGKYLVIKEMR